LARTRRTTRLRIVALVVTFLGVGIAVKRVRHRRLRRAAMSDVQEALRAYSECVVGPALMDGEEVAGRIARVELGLPESPPPAAAEAEWPRRCAGELDRARAALVAAGGAEGDPNVAHLDEVAVGARRELSTIEDAAARVDAVIVAARLAGLD